LVLTGLLCLTVALVSSAADKTLTGKISDSMCGASHAGMAHGGKKSSDRDCTEACVKDGSKYVVVSQGKVYEVQNQDFAGLKEHAGHNVKVTGEVGADGKTIKVSNIEMGGGKKKKET